MRKGEPIPQHEHRDRTDGGPIYRPERVPDHESAASAVSSGLSAHVGAADPHTGYRLESADHSHATTGLQAGVIASSVVSVTPFSTIAATNVQAALEEIVSEGGGGYTDEQAQDAVGTILTDSTSIDFTYTDATPAITASVITGTTAAAIGTSAGGSAATPSKSDHVHAASGDTPSTQAIGDSAAAGTSAKAAQSDHKHAMPAFGTGPAAIGTQANGSSANIARIDHVHATGAGTPSTQAFGDAAATGSGPAAAMSDHKHAMPASPSGTVTHSQLGTTSAGASFDTARGVYLKKITLASSGVLLSIAAAVKGNGTNGVAISAGLYDDNSSAPGKVIAVMGPIQKESDNSAITQFGLSTTVRFITIPIGAWLASGDYWIAVAIHAAADSRMQIAQTATTGGTDRTRTGASAAQFHDESFSASTTVTTKNYSIYADILTLS